MPCHPDRVRRNNEPVESLEHSAKLLALSLTEEMTESLRSEWGNTNVAVLQYWRDKVLTAVKGTL